MCRPKGRLYDMNIEHSILADFRAEWGLCLRHVIPTERQNLCGALLVTTLIFIDIVA
jgi:hypothetical protein